MNNLCACLGPQCGENFCPCVMQSLGLERSLEWQEKNSSESIAKINSEMKEAFTKLFERNKKGVNYD